MALGRKGLTSGAIKGLTVCMERFTMCAVCVFYWRGMLCREIQSSMSLLAGERSVLFTNRSLFCQFCRQSPNAARDSP
ncbi:unnamed protein product [Staurois parvus]|uniref:Uncharacterized protein n=1 Tax=Staurois parvus TaxID=386267 RepID=A0ABN9AXJ7_9NEOB|nr:unnamed protein product [Staurois parvus]